MERLVELPQSVWIICDKIVFKFYSMFVLIVILSKAKNPCLVCKNDTDRDPSLRLG